MRIITGALKGRKFDAPKGHKTHPMSERVRGALFNILGDIDNLTVLDAYAGSGALGFEALSRGAKSSYFIELDRLAFNIIQKNIEFLELEQQARVTNANVMSWSKRNEDKKFDILLLDPPYDKIDLSTVSDLKIHVKPNGLMVLSYSGRESAPTVNGVVVVDNKSYGDAALAFYRLD